MSDDDKLRFILIAAMWVTTMVLFGYLLVLHCEDYLVVFE